MEDNKSQTQTVVAALESAWESGSIPELSGSIPPEAAADIDLLTDLVCVDLEYRIQQDVDTRIEMYTAVYPELGKDDLILLELIRTEYTFRADRDSVNVSSYTDRFRTWLLKLKPCFVWSLIAKQTGRQAPRYLLVPYAMGKFRQQPNAYAKHAGIRSRSEDTSCWNVSEKEALGLSFGLTTQNWTARLRSRFPDPVGV